MILELFFQQFSIVSMGILCFFTITSFCCIISLDMLDTLNFQNYCVSWLEVNNNYSF